MNSTAILTVRAVFTPLRVNHLMPESERHTPMLSALNAANEPAPPAAD
jgi:hypothetical protein